MDVYENLKKAGYELPEAPPLGGVYKPVKQVGNLLFVSGHGCTVKGVPVYTGQAGGDCSFEDAQEAGKLCVLNALASLHNFLGDLNKIKSVVKVLALVQSAPGFHDQPKVINAASQLLADVFGEENGIGTRSAMGTNNLPGNITVEIEFMFEV